MHSKENNIVLIEKNLIIQRTLNGYVVTSENKKLFFMDKKHKNLKSLYYIIKNNLYILGFPFGNNIYPIIGVKQIKIDPLSIFFAKRDLWMYYRKLAENSTKKQKIEIVNHFKKNFQEFGLHALYKELLSSQVEFSTQII